MALKMKDVQVTEQEENALALALSHNMPFAPYKLPFDKTDVLRMVSVRRAVAAKFYTDER